MNSDKQQSSEKKTCLICAYRGTIPGSAHSQCLYRWSHEPGPTLPAGSPHGIRNGWYFFPANYDPTWMIEECKAYAEIADPALMGTKPDVRASIIGIVIAGRMMGF